MLERNIAVIISFGCGSVPPVPANAGISLPLLSSECTPSTISTGLREESNGLQKYSLSGFGVWSGGGLVLKAGRAAVAKTQTAVSRARVVQFFRLLLAPMAVLAERTAVACFPAGATGA